MKITKECDSDLWWKISKDDSRSTFFQSPIWHQWVQSVYPNYNKCTISFRTDSGKMGVVPLLETDKILAKYFSKLNSTYAGNYGGYLSDSILSEADEIKLWRSIPGWRTGAFSVRGNPFKRNHFQNLGGNFTSGSDSTHIVFLDKVQGELRDVFTHSNRTNINRAEDSGLSVNLATSIESYKNYYRIYLDTQERWGDKKNNSYPERFFLVGYEKALKYPEHIKLWEIKLNGETIAGALIFYWNKHVVAWHAASLTEHLNLRPNNYLHYMIMKDAMEKGFVYYDFNPSAGLKGVEKFKEGFGAEKVFFQNLNYLNPILKLRSKFG